MANEKSNAEVATLGGGCFWCVEAVFQNLMGVSHVTSGYSGGHVDNPTYREVCYGQTGHAEVVQVHFDSAIISFAEILEVFWTAHNPTTIDQQGADRGPQYRSIILYHTKEQKQIAEESIKNVATKLYDDPIVTQLVPFETYYIAEDKHQNYYNDNTSQGYCRVVISPKIAKVRQKFAHKLKV